MQRLTVRSVTRRLRDGTAIVHGDLRHAAVVLEIDDRSLRKLLLAATRDEAIAPFLDLLSTAEAEPPCDPKEG